MRRSHNGAAGVLCNWIIDSVPPGMDWRRVVEPTDLSTGSDPSVFTQVSAPDSLYGHAAAAYSLVLQEIAIGTHLIKACFVSSLPGLPCHRPVPRQPAPIQVYISARNLPSEFATVFLVAYLRTSSDASRRGGGVTRLAVSFTIDAAFLAAGPGPLRLPRVDAYILDALIADPHLGIAGTLEIFRDQTSDDNHPNKTLRPCRYRLPLPSTPSSSTCATSRSGGDSYVGDPVGRGGARPVQDNYIGAVTGASIVIDKLLVDYCKGRFLSASVDTLKTDTGF
ncbi:hypothetical protein PI124_g4983 [Phytophthora idaei]|nr:hypothetical protein PI124_g4983 [Phytophthora idaei]